jgi:hypothetical protein
MGVNDEVTTTVTAAETKKFNEGRNNQMTTIRTVADEVTARARAMRTATKTMSTTTLTTAMTITVAIIFQLCDRNIYIVFYKKLG